MYRLGYVLFSTQLVKAGGQLGVWGEQLWIMVTGSLMYIIVPLFGGLTFIFVYLF